MFKNFGGYKDEKNHISALPTPTGWNLAVRRLKNTCTNPAKFIKICWTKCNIMFINLAATEFQKHSFLWISDPIPFNLRQPIAFLQVVTELNNKDTLKVCRKITIITDSKLGFFLAMRRNQGWNSRYNFKNYRFKSYFFVINCLPSIRKIIDFCQSAWKVG